MGDAVKLYKKSPDNADLAKLFSGIAHRYYEIGTLLGVGQGELEGLLHNLMSNKVKLTQVFQRWMDAYHNVTWGKIVYMCEDLGDNQTKASVVTFLGREEAQGKYLERPDFPDM